MLTKEQEIDRICDIKTIAETLDSESLEELARFLNKLAREKWEEKWKIIYEQLREEQLNNPVYIWE